MMQKNHVRLLLAFSLCILVISGIGPPLNVIENVTGINLLTGQIVALAHQNMAQISPWYDQASYSLSIPPPETNYYSEDFTTTTYQDAPNTNTSGWGSGTLRLPRNGPTFAGSYDTPNRAYGVFVDGDYAYIADEHTGLLVFNITTPSQPSLIGTCDTPVNANDVFVSGDYAYVADGSSGLQVVNITNPSQPTLVGSYNTPGSSQDVFVSGDYAYVADEGQGLQVINVTVPYNPSFAGSYNTAGYSYGVFVSGHYAYIADFSSGLQVIDVTDPSLPSLGASYDTPGDALDVFVWGDFAYVADGGTGLQVINITIPTHPSLAGSYDTTGAARGVEVWGDFAYVADGGTGLQVINITIPTHPSLAGNCDTPGYTWGVSVSRDYAYLADDGQGLQVIKIADYILPSFVGSYTTSGDAFDVFVSGDFAYVACRHAGLQVVNITDPSQPSLAGSYNTPNIALGVWVSGNYAYVADVNSLQVINITDPSHPSFIGSRSTPDSAWDVMVSGNYAYVAVASAGLYVINVTDPSQPILVGSYNTPGVARGVWISGNYAYVADYLTGLQVVNITDPSQPTLAGSYDPGYAYGVCVSGNYAYVTDYNTGLHAINITMPSQPSLAGTCNTPGYAWGVSVSGNYAYVSGMGAGLQIVNITTPSLSTLIGSYDTPGNTYNMWISGDFAYIADYTAGGLQVVEVQRNRCRQYASPATAQSLPVYTSTSTTVLYANLTVTATQPAETTLTYEMSADDGFHWEAMTPGIEHTFTYPGARLRWRVTLSASSTFTTPALDALFITITTKLSATTLIAPSNGTPMSDNTPTFNWNTIPGAVNYLLQLDTTMSFTSPNLRNMTEVTPPVMLATSISDGVWYWRVAANDSDGDLGYFSTIWNLTIDTQPPTWNPVPTNQVVELGAPFYYNLNASDPLGIDAWQLNDTTHFAIDVNGVITNTIPLSVNVYGLQVWVNDSMDNVQTVTFSVTVQDTTAPIWDSIPTDQVCEFDTSFTYVVAASDLAGIDHYWINDTARFAIGVNTGIITNNTVLPVGRYGVEVQAYDAHNHHCSATFAISVVDTTAPIWVIEPTDQFLDYGETFDYQLSAWDLSGINQWRINDTVHFAITNTGRITNMIPLDPGTYHLLITVDDIYNNELSVSITIFVRTTTTNGGINPLFLLLVGGGMAGGVLVTLLIVGILYLVKRPKTPNT